MSTNKHIQCLLCNHEVEQYGMICDTCKELESKIPQCAICGTKIPEKDIICDKCGENEKYKWMRKES